MACNTTIEKTPEPVIAKTFAQESLDAVNAIRIAGCDCGSKYFKPTTKLVWNTKLEAAAKMHSVDMFTQKYFNHKAPNGTGPDFRLKAQNYKWKIYGENIYMTGGFDAPVSTAIQAWKDSPIHCENMMDPDFKDLGMAEHQKYWTQLFGSE